MNQMLITVSTQRFQRSVRLPDGDVASARGDDLEVGGSSWRCRARSSRTGWQATCRLWTCWRSRSARPGGPDPCRGSRPRRHGREAPAGAGREGHRECRHDSGAARQPRRARPRPGGGAAVHHRRRQGPVQGDPPHLRQEHADPALSGFTRPGTLPSVCPGRRTPRCARLSAGLGDGGGPNS
jgi:hypothetical protein